MSEKEKSADRMLAERYFALLKESNEQIRLLQEKLARQAEESVPLKEHEALRRECERISVERDQWKDRFELIYHSKVVGKYLSVRERLDRAIRRK